MLMVTSQILKSVDFTETHKPGHVKNETLFNRDLNRDCLVYMISLRFLGSKFLINLRRQFRVRKIFRTQVFAGLTVFLFCV